MALFYNKCSNCLGANFQANYLYTSFMRNHADPRNDNFSRYSQRNIGWWQRYSVYHALIKLSWTQFMLGVFLFYATINLSFALFFYLMGPTAITGNQPSPTRWEAFTNALYFSTQTMATVGYGNKAPVSQLANFVAAIESLVGILSFALVTGLFYTRFSRPRAFLVFSRWALVSPHRGGRAVTFRVTPFRNNSISDAEALATVALTEEHDGERRTVLHKLSLEADQINSLALGWTLVHPITKGSPLFGMDQQTLAKRLLELSVDIKGFDDSFANEVHGSATYPIRRILFGAAFCSMTRPGRKSRMVLELADIDKAEPAPLPPPDVPAEDDLSEQGPDLPLQAWKT